MLTNYARMKQRTLDVFESAATTPEQLGSALAGSHIMFIAGNMRSHHSPRISCAHTTRRASKVQTAAGNLHDKLQSKNLDNE